MLMTLMLLLLDLGIIGASTNSQQPIALGGESGVEESEEEDEEWNYIKVEEKKSQSELGAVEDNINIENRTEELPTAPIEEANKEFDFNVSN